MRLIILCCIVPMLALIFGVKVDESSVNSILNMLVAVAAAIFTIMSIWIAFLYPNVLKTLKGENLLNADFSGGGADTARLKEIIAVIIQSAMVMILSIASLLRVAVLEYSMIVEFIQFSVLFSGMLQITILISTININVGFVTVLERHRSKRAKDYDA